MQHNELSAIISLLDDPDESIFIALKSKLINEGIQVIPELEQAWEHCESPIQQQRIESIIHTIQFEQTIHKLREWIETGGTSLLEGALIVSRYQYPSLNELKIRNYIEQLKQDVWLELTPHLTAMENVKVLNHILFDVHGFSGNNEDFHHPHNSMINMVLESKKGNPLSLSIIYAVIAQMLDVPVYGVNLPQHFILAYMGSNHGAGSFDFRKREVLFYINAFSKGTIFSRKEVEVYLKQLQLAPNDIYFYPCTNLEMIKRMLNNLMFAFEKSGQNDKVNEIKKLISNFNS